jgi:hypothetical protein
MSYWLTCCSVTQRYACTLNNCYTHSSQVKHRPTAFRLRGLITTLTDLLLAAIVRRARTAEPAQPTNPASETMNTPPCWLRLPQQEHALELLRQTTRLHAEEPAQQDQHGRQPACRLSQVNTTSSVSKLLVEHDLEACQQPPAT